MGQKPALNLLEASLWLIFPTHKNIASEGAQLILVGDLLLNMIWITVTLVWSRIMDIVTITCSIICHI